MSRSLSETLEHEGCVLVDSGLAEHELETLCALVESAAATSGRGGRRLALERLPPPLRELPGRETWRGLVERAVGGPPRVVRAILFDKSDRARWRVGWHRDTVVPLEEAWPVGGFSAPSVKAGQPHARAPREVLETMIALRLHLDPADESNGCLRVLPGSHRDDRPAPPGPHGGEALTARAGQALILRPLLLHSSEKPRTMERRRVLHLDLAGPQPLPGGLRWPSASDARCLDI